ncbi:MAG: APC family permease [Gemmatimonadota bacterium]
MTRLRRELGVVGATMMGMGAMVGTGVFVSLGLAAGIAGPAVLLALALAAGVAACNALSSAQLAASHPVSGGTYEYGYRYLRPWMGFTAGWMFLCAKSASAATAALGFAGYLLSTLGAAPDARLALVATAAVTVVGMTLVVAGGMRRSNVTNILIVSVTLVSLLVFVVAGFPMALREGAVNFTDFTGTGAETAWGPSLLQATALMFVAYTGYGRIATLGEEVREPRHTIPRAIIITVGAVMVIYMAVGVVALGSVGAGTLGSLTQQQAAPLELAAARFPWTGARWVVAVGAMTAMLGVLLNLLLGLSRVLLAMGRRRDMPSQTSRLDPEGTTPWVAVLVMGAVVLGLTLVGNVKTTWSFSAFTVLLYYAITNLAALSLPARARLYPRWVAWLGLASCLFLAFWVDAWIWMVGLGLVGAGLIWFTLAERIRG